ncbi:MAG: hypothetical protein PVJ56_21240 [Desulfobacterales bacterium]|jgi:hypothetical protein
MFIKESTYLSQEEVLKGEVGLILEEKLPKIDLLLPAITLNGSNLMSEHQRPG